MDKRSIIASFVAHVNQVYLYCVLGVPYTIEVVTGNKSNAGTSAKVYIIMYGGKDGNQTSGKVWLHGGSFTRGRTDVFDVEVADMLSPLSRIDIGHDNSGAGAGWFLDRVSYNMVHICGSPTVLVIC